MAIADNARQMTCMEVWGGNQVADSGVVMAGLDAWVFSQPYQGAASGGDVYYVSSCATGRITRLLVADVSGHGTHVSETAGELRLLMRRYVNHISQTSFVGRMNNQFGALAKSGGFATAVVATFFAPNNGLAFSNAGHPPPFWYQARRRRWVQLDAEFVRAKKPGGKRSRDTASDGKQSTGEASGESIGDLPLGIADDIDYAEHRVRLDVGDLVLFHTDSLIESRSADGQLLGMDGLQRVIEQVDPREPQTLIPRLLEAIRSLHPGNLTDDDVTVLLFRPNGLMPSVPIGNRVRAPFRVLGGILGSLLRGGRGMPLPEFSLANLGGALFNPFSKLARYEDDDNQEATGSAPVGRDFPTAKSDNGEPRSR